MFWDPKISCCYLRSSRRFELCGEKNASCGGEMFLATTEDQPWVRKDSWWDSWGASLCYQIGGSTGCSCVTSLLQGHVISIWLLVGGRREGAEPGPDASLSYGSKGREVKLCLLMEENVSCWFRTELARQEGPRIWKQVNSGQRFTNAWLSQPDAFPSLGIWFLTGGVPSCVLWPLPNASFGTLKTVEYFFSPLHSSSINFCGLSILLRYWGFSHSIAFSFQYCELFFLGKEGGFDNIQWFFWNFCNNFGLIVIGMSFFACTADVAIYTANSLLYLYSVNSLYIRYGWKSIFTDVDQEELSVSVGAFVCLFLTLVFLLQWKFLVQRLSMWSLSVSIILTSLISHSLGFFFLMSFLITLLYKLLSSQLLWFIFLEHSMRYLNSKFSSSSLTATNSSSIAHL